MWAKMVTHFIRRMYEIYWIMAWMQTRTWAFILLWAPQNEREVGKVSWRMHPVQHTHTTQPFIFLLKSKHRCTLRVGILNPSENLQVRSAQTPFQQNSKSLYHSFNCAVGTQWPFSVCLKYKYGKHIHIHWYLVDGSNAGLWSCHCFRERKISLLSGHYWVNFKSTNLSIAQVAWASQA